MSHLPWRHIRHMSAVAMKCALLSNELVILNRMTWWLLAVHRVLVHHWSRVIRWHAIQVLLVHGELTVTTGWEIILHEWRGGIASETSPTCPRWLLLSFHRCR